MTNLALKLERGEHLEQIIRGASLTDVEAKLIAWLDEQPPALLDGLTVRSSAVRACTMSFTSGAVILTTRAGQRAYATFGAAQDAFVRFAVRPLDGWQWM